jgi:sugar O-acyltransferase (sialic acid O-acetyltransferase NeuD family)
LSDRAVIFGFGGHARVVHSILEDRFSRFVFATSDGMEGTERVDDVLGALDQFADAEFFVAIGDNTVRERLHGILVAGGARVGTAISSFSHVARDATIGIGSVICPGAVIGPQAIVGENAIVNTLTSVDHDCVVGDHAQLTGGVTLGGTTAIGERCFLGVKSATIPGITIGAGTSVMAGAVVVHDLPPGVVAGGVPARIVKRA